MFGKFLSLIAAFSFAVTPFAANAAGRANTDARLTAVSLGVGAASTAAFFAFNDWHWKWDSSRHGITAFGAGVLTTIGCAALSPIVATAVIDRPLTYRQAHVLMGSCVIPIIGGRLVSKAYDNRILWAPDEESSTSRPWKKKMRR